MSHVEPCCSASNESTRISQLSFPNGTQGTTEHRMHCDSAYTISSTSSGVDQGCPHSTCGFSAAIDPVLRSVVADTCRQCDSSVEFFAYLGRLVRVDQQYLLQIFVLIAAATRTVNLELQPSKIQLWRAFCQDPIPPELQDKIKLTLSWTSSNPRWHWTQSHCFGRTTTMEKPRNASSGLPPRLPTSMQKDFMRRQ